MLFSDMINQLKCTELCSLKKSILKGGLFGYNQDRKVRISPFPHRRGFHQGHGRNIGKQYLDMKVGEVFRLSSQALICMPQICAWSTTGLLKPEVDAGCKGLGRALEIEDLAFAGQPPSPMVYR